ncbi:MAG: Ig-like domain-containing protein [Lachnospiraceae bacterium]|nr:Ig-like domain-containing protein [Lachnospiraceae bacterium]
MKVSKNLKKIISFFVAVAMIITMLPQGQLVNAATEMIAERNEDCYPLFSEESTEGAGLNIQSPVYNADGTVTFHYVSATSEASIGVRGHVKRAGKKDLIKAEEVKLGDGNSLYVATSAAITEPGIYEYSFYTLDAMGMIEKELGDPACTTIYGDSCAFVRNPNVSELGLVTIYYPNAAEGACVYYKDAASATGTQLKVGDKVTADIAKANGYTAVKMEVDKDFSGGTMYSAKYAGKVGTFQYVIADKDGVVIKDVCNHTGADTYKVEKVDELALAVQSPVVQTDGSTVKFMYLDEKLSAKTISVAGSFNDWTKDKYMMTMDGEGKGIYSVEIPGFVPGVYQYKFVIDGGNWIGDPLCEFVVSNDANSAVVVPGLVPETQMQAQIGTSTTLPDKVKMYSTGSLEAKLVDVTYELKDPKTAGVSLAGKELTIADNFEGTSVDIVISNGATKTNYTVEVVKDMYEVTIHYYAKDTSTYAEKDLWIWQENGISYKTGFTFNQENFKDEVGREWATAKYAFPINNFSVIVRTGGDTWADQEVTRSIALPEGAKSGEFWIIEGNKNVFDKWAAEFAEQDKHWVIVEYERPNGDYDGWNLYTWNALDEYNEVSNMFKNVNGKYQTVFAIDVFTTNVGYLLRSGTPQKEDWSDVTKDMEGDRSIITPIDQKVVKVKLTQGSLEAEYVPYNKGYEFKPDEKMIVFYYRDDDLFLNGQLASLQKVQVEVNGQLYDMTYNEKNERYEYLYKNATTGEYAYSYNITNASGETVTVLDKFNAVTNTEGTKSLLTYKDLQANVTVTSSAVSMSYDENMVIGVGIDNKEVQVKEAYVDLTALGGDAKVAIDPELMAVTIGVTDTTSLGEKTITVTVVDQYNKTFQATHKITVTNRVLKGENDFDWDEAVIYFMVTDRFCDGNAANNDAYGVGDYNLNGPSSYHGGDFAGVTSKLDYLKELGINTIWITPVVENITADMQAKGTNGEAISSYGYTGYWASNFEKLNAHLGTVDEFHTLIDEAHERGIRIMVDVVLNHSGYGGRSMDNFAGMFRDTDIEGNVILGPLDGLPDFATEKAQVRNQLINWQTAWVSEIAVTKKGNTIDYFRVDTVKHVESTTWAAFKNALTNVSSKFKMIGEYAGAAYTEDFGYLESGKMDSLLDFGFNDMANRFVQGSLESIESQLVLRNTKINNVGTFGSFINSHDEDGLKHALLTAVDDAGKNKYTNEQADALAKVAASLVITAKGQPVIYYGEEIGLTGANDYPYQTNRYDMQFDNLTQEQYSMLNHYKKLLGIRNEYSKVFAKGDRTTVAVSDKEKYSIFKRSYKGQDIIIGLNISSEEKQVNITLKDFAGSTITDIYNNVSYKVASNGKVAIKIPSAANGGTVALVSDSQKKVKEATIDALQNAKKNNTSLILNAQDSSGNANAIWTFSEANLKKASSDDLKDVKITCTVEDGTNHTKVKDILKKDSKNSKAAVITFTHTGTLPVNAKVKVNLANQSSLSYGSRIYVYRLNGTKLQEVVVSTAQISEDGYVTLYLAQGGTYVLLPKKPSSSVITKFTYMLKVKVGETTLKKGEKTIVKVTVPTAIMKKLASLSATNMKKVQTAQLGVKVTYKSSNKNVATVNSSGKITAKKKGKATITVTFKFSNGTKHVVKKKITVK